MSFWGSGKDKGERKDLVLPIEKRLVLPGQGRVREFDLAPFRSQNAIVSMINFLNRYQEEPFSLYTKNSDDPFELWKQRLVFLNVEEKEGIEGREMNLDFSTTNNYSGNLSFPFVSQPRFAFLPFVGSTKIAALYLSKGFLNPCEGKVRGGPNPYFDRIEYIYIPESHYK